MKILQIFVLILGLVIFADAQILSGKVYDLNGALVSKAKVTAVNEKGEIFSTETDEEGMYLLSLPYKYFDAKTSSANFKISKYQIIVDQTNRGFEKFVFKDFKFVPNLSGKMYFDIALDSINPEPCGYAGADCLSGDQIKIEELDTKISDKILQRPLETLPKEQNKNKRKNN